MTSLLDRLLGREPSGVTLGRGTSIKAVDGGGWLAAYQQGGINLSSLSLEPQDKAAKLLAAYKVGWFNKAERKISTDFAGLGVSVAPENDAGDNQADVIEPDLSTPWAQLDPVGQFLRLMEKPNPYQTGRQLRQKTMIRLDMAGWCFWYIERAEDGLVAENGVYGISPSRLWPSYNKAGTLIGYVLDKNQPSGPTMTFEVDEIIPFSYGSADDEMVYGVGVVEAVWSQLSLTDLMARHTADLLTTGGRMAGMMWPKERSLDEAEFQDATRAWRSVVSDPNSARRLLLFPEPMEWQNGSSTPDEIGIPELASLNRDEILTAFPISPYMLGTPFAGGLNESGASRREEKATYWEETIHPRVELFEETIQTYLMPRYEQVVGYTLDFEVEEPQLDDAPSLIEKAGAFSALADLGFDEKEAVAAVGLDHIKFLGRPKPDPLVVDASTLAVSAADPSPKPPTTSVNVGPKKSQKVAQVEAQANHVLEPATARALDRMTRFFSEQQRRVKQAWEKLPPTKAARATKSDPDWWDAQREDAELTATMRAIYVDVGQGGLQAVADNLERVIVKGITQNVIADLLEFGGERVKDINARTLEALTIQLAEGTRRGYSIPQLINGVPGEGYAGLDGVALDNGTPAFSELRAETIARTETMLSYNRATVTGYKEFGVTHLLAYDGDGDEQCAARNGLEFTVAEAQEIADHPNGTLVWSPVVDKAVHTDQVADLARLFVEAIKSMGTPTPVYITNEAPRAPDMSFTPDIHVTTPDVHVTTPDVKVNIEPAEPSVFNITTPDITVEPAHVNITSPALPDVHLNVTTPDQPAPVVNVTVPEQAAPVVNVKSQPVVVNTPAEIAITSMPDRVTQRNVKRDKRGLIDTTTEVESDA